MAVLSSETLYSLLGFAWTLLVVGTVAVVYTGTAEPTVDASLLPASPVVTGAAAAALVVAGWLLVTRRIGALWREAGRSAGLEPATGSALSALGLGSKPELTGTVDGRPVRVHTESRKTGTSTEGGSTHSTYTVVETELENPASAGAAVLRRSLDGGETDDVDLGNTSVRTVAIDDDFAALGGESGLAEALVTGTGRDRLLALDPGTTVFAGDAKDSILDAVPEMPQDSFLGGMATDALAKELPSTPETVAIQAEGTTLDGDALRRRAEGVAAAADAFEAATGGEE